VGPDTRASSAEISGLRIPNMKALDRVERALWRALRGAVGPRCPERLEGAMRHAVFPGGGRVRPRLCLATARACGDGVPALTDAVVVAIELLHCASLVHDDLPCFDDAATRRGRPSVHRAFGEQIAVLVGDALVVLAFQTVAKAGIHAPQRVPGIIETIAAGVGVPNGIIAGQALESEPHVVLTDYHRAKTASLFEAATVAGALAAGRDSRPWRSLGMLLGEAYQIADDLRDVAGDPVRIGKPVGQDAARGRPSAVLEFGVSGAIMRLERLFGDAFVSIPTCPGAGEVREMVLTIAELVHPARLGLPLVLETGQAKEAGAPAGGKEYGTAAGATPLVGDGPPWRSDGHLAAPVSSASSARTARTRSRT
jgi:geranylgeranyl diphosphate synthase type II